jgi:hypothetical protein
MYDAYNAFYDELLELQKALFVDEANWAFAEAFTN